MYHTHTYTCNRCGDEIELSPIPGLEPGKCRECGIGMYQFSGETYDQDFIDQQKYEEQQDREYEERHRYDDREGR